MDEQHPFRLYLTSDSSSEFFPKNTKTSFGVHLSGAIRLQGRWEVAISEIITTSTISPQDSPVFIYCNISEKVFLSDSQSRCLRVLPPLSSTTFNSFTFDHLYFEKVEFSEFQDVLIQLKNNLGEAYPLKSSGPATTLVLSFKPPEKNVG